MKRKPAFQDFSAIIAGGVNMMRWFYGNGWGYGWGGILMGLPMIVLWVGIIIGIVYPIRSISRNGGGFNKSKTPMEILKERYAKEEINDDDYERMKNKLDDN